MEVISPVRPIRFLLRGRGLALACERLALDDSGFLYRLWLRYCRLARTAAMTPAVPSAVASSAVASAR